MFIEKMPAENVPLVFIISKKSTNDTSILVKQTEACLFTQNKIAQYRNENRLFLFDPLNQRVIIQKNDPAMERCEALIDLAESLKKRSVIEFKTSTNTSQPVRASLQIATVEEVSEEEFNTMVAASLKAAADQLEKGKKVAESFSKKAGTKNNAALRELVRHYVQFYYKSSTDDIVQRMLDIWNEAAKDDRQQQEAAEKKYQRLVDDIQRRIRQDGIKKDEIESTQEKQSLINTDLTRHGHKT